MLWCVQRHHQQLWIACHDDVTNSSSSQPARQTVSPCIERICWKWFSIDVGLASVQSRIYRPVNRWSRDHQTVLSTQAFSRLSPHLSLLCPPPPTSLVSVHPALHTHDCALIILTMTNYLYEVVAVKGPMLSYIHDVIRTISVSMRSQCGFSATDGRAAIYLDHIEC